MNRAEVRRHLQNRLRNRWGTVRMLTALLMAITIAAAGCGTGKTGKKKDDFFTSGSREADQRASQTMAKHEQLSGSGEGAGEKEKEKKARVKESDKSSAGVTNAAQAEEKLSLYDRLGGQPGISNIVTDFLPRALNDPRVNWERKGVAVQRSWFRRSRDYKPLWVATPQNTAQLRTHMVQFISLATGGPSNYEGKEIKASHANMKITNPEFDAVIGDLKASLDRLKIPNKEQKELLAIIESTRPQIVTVR